MEWMARRGATVAGYITSTREQLRHLPGHLWAILFYCLQSRLDYWLRLLPTDTTRRAAQAVDAALLSTVEAAGRPGMFTEDDGTPAEGVMLRRLRLPARRKGAGRALSPRAGPRCLPTARRRWSQWSASCQGRAPQASGRCWSRSLALAPSPRAGIDSSTGSTRARLRPCPSSWRGCAARLRCATRTCAARSTTSRAMRASRARGSCSTRSPCNVSRLSISGSLTYSRASRTHTQRGALGWRWASSRRP